jgi:hypothetical protein
MLATTYVALISSLRRSLRTKPNCIYLIEVFAVIILHHNPSHTRLNHLGKAVTRLEEKALLENQNNHNLDHVIWI